MQGYFSGKRFFLELQQHFMGDRFDFHQSGRRRNHSHAFSFCIEGHTARLFHSADDRHLAFTGHFESDRYSCFGFYIAQIEPVAHFHDLAHSFI
ncbi:hypothetical protein SDC9_154038 [bioreactor metagenome]|uniref:Uncharacterized protein n=1 Tax=bioreactor metagenome TaxID=1076179 RepID=A0A645EXN9_9ZZZZ